MQGNSLRDPILKKPSQKRAGGVAQGVSPEFKPLYCKKKKEKKRIRAYVRSNIKLCIQNGKTSWAW
jgi:hypothetical protein